MLQARGFAQKSDALMLIYPHWHILGTKVEPCFMCGHVFFLGVIAGVQVVKERRPGFGRRATLEGQFEVMANNHEDGFTKGLMFIRTPQDLRPKMFQCGGWDDVYGVKRLTTARHISFGLHVRLVECVLKAAWMMLKDTSRTASFQGWIDNIIDPAGSPTWTQVSATEERHVWEENVGIVAPPAISKTLS